MNDGLVTFQALSDSAVQAEIEIKAAPEKVYAAWTQPEQLVKWFGPRTGGRLQIDHFDCAVGGRFDVTMVFADGDQVQMFGAYQALIPAQKLVFTWHWQDKTDSPTVSGETLVTVDLSPTEAGTHLTLTHERFTSTEDRDRHQQGWGMLLNRLATTPKKENTMQQTKDQLTGLSVRLLHLFAFVPEDKLIWAPSPTAQSALHIVAHCGLTNRFFAQVLTGTLPVPMPTVAEFFQSLHAVEPYPTRESAVALVNETLAELCQAIDSVSPTPPDTLRKSPVGTFAIQFWIDQSKEHLIYHAGQLAYLQTLWGDLDNHIG